MERIRSTLGQMFAEICAVWLGPQPFSPEGGYTMIHDTYLFFVPAHVRYVYTPLVICRFPAYTNFVRIEKLADVVAKCDCQHLLFLTDAPTLQLHIEEILKSRLNSGAVRNFLWLTNANSSTSATQHQSAIKVQINLFHLSNSL